MGGCGVSPFVVLGETQTCLLPSSTVLDTSSTIELLSSVQPGTAVTSRERPMPLVISPDRIEGIDCNLIPVSGKRIHVIGTVASRAVVLGGRILQSSSYTRVVRSRETSRQPWSHYTGRPGTIETVSRIGDDPAGRVADGYLRSFGGDRLDLTAISTRMSTHIRMDHQWLDQRMPFRADTTRLLWAIEVGAPTGDPHHFTFRLENETLRSVRLTVPEEYIPAAQRFCEDLAVHDWLLTTVGQVAIRFRPPDHGPETVLNQLSPTLDQLVPLWMPGAHTPQSLRQWWSDLETDPGFTRQWTARVQQLRDRMATATLQSLRDPKFTNRDW